MGHARPIRLRARRLSGSVTSAAVAALVLSACGGEPEAQETVGPTAGPPTSATQTYEPTLPPYTSDVELTEEETEQVEATLLAIDELFFHASSLSSDSLAGLERMASNKQVANDLYDAHEELANEASSGNQELVGTMEVTETAIWEYAANDFGYFGVCLNYNNWGLVDSTTGLNSEGEEPPESRLQVASLKAYYEDGKPVLQDLLFGAPEDECNDL